MPDETPAAMAIAVRALVGCEVIDGGDTVALRICCADGRPAAILVPREVARAIGETLSEKVIEAAAKIAGRPGR